MQREGVIDTCPVSSSRCGCLTSKARSPSTLAVRRRARQAPPRLRQLRHHRATPEAGPDRGRARPADRDGPPRRRGRDHRAGHSRHPRLSERACPPTWRTTPPAATPCKTRCGCTAPARSRGRSTPSRPTPPRPASSTPWTNLSPAPAAAVHPPPPTARSCRPAAEPAPARPSAVATGAGPGVAHPSLRADRMSRLNPGWRRCWSQDRRTPAPRRYRPARHPASNKLGS